MRRVTITDNMGNSRRISVAKSALLTMQNNTPEQEEICKIIINSIKTSGIAYDYVIGYETKDDSTYVDHIHIAIYFDKEYNIESLTKEFTDLQKGTNIIGLNIKYPKDSDEEAWQNWREYARKGGRYEWLHPVYPTNVSDENPEWISWQREVIEEKQSDRQVTVVIDKRGGIGKSYLGTWHEVRKQAVCIEIIENYKDILRQVFNQPADWYIIDIPRALSCNKDEKDTKKKQTISNLFAAIEKIKDGKSYDDRYKFRKRNSNPPKITVLLNDEPDENLLTNDRWRKVWINQEEHEKAKREIAEIRRRKAATKANTAVIEKDGRQATEKQPDDQHALKI